MPFAHGDKIAHAGAFAFLVLFAALACARQRGRFLLLLGALHILAIGSEAIQASALLPQRQGDGWDLLANFAGLWVGLLAVGLGRRMGSGNPTRPAVWPDLPPAIR